MTFQDSHCLNAFLNYVGGTITKEECQKELSLHGDFLLFEMLESGFKAVYTFDRKDWADVVGNEGTS